MDDVRKVQHALGEVTEAKASLELWLPHITTVGDGIEVNDTELTAIKDSFKTLSRNTHPFNVTLQDILKIDFRKGGKGEETTPYGLYLDVKTNDALLKLVDDVAKITTNSKKWYFMPSPYHPHCALAFKDLSKEGFEKGIEYLDGLNLRYSASLDHVALVEMLPNATRELVRFYFAR